MRARAGKEAAVAGAPGRRRARESQAARFARIHAGLRERICLLQYPPGTVLNESEIAAEFGVSRTPVRGVLQRLAYEGLVVTRNGVGTIVTDVDLKILKDVYDLRIHLAELSGVLSPRPAGAADIDAVRALLARCEGLSEGRDIEEYARINNALQDRHLALMGNAALAETTELLYYRVARIWFQFVAELDWGEVVETLRRELGETIVAMEKGDARSLGRIRRRHLAGMLRWIGRYISGD
jgi:DNA-binding GntR family transcriptional regulator